MSSLFAGLGVARQALQAQQFGLDVTQNNIANANTPGYARQRINLTPGDPVFQSTYALGMGVRLGSVDSYRSKFIDHRVNDELQAKGEYESASTALQQVESIFNEGQGAGLQTSLSAFFNSLSALSTTPEDISLRQQVLTRADDLCNQFRQCYERLQSIQNQQNGLVADTVDEINTITSAIAKLNVEIQTARGANTNETTLVDQRQQLLDKLSGFVDISYFEDDSGGVTVMSRQGTLMVVGNTSNSFTAGFSGGSTMFGVYAEGKEITSTIKSGSLGGALNARDVTIAGYLKSLDDLAAGIMDRVNAVHTAGVDLAGTQGGAFFAYSHAVGSNLGAARSMQVLLDDPQRIAAAEVGGGPGSNANALALSNIKNEGFLPGGANLDQYYSSFIFQIGLNTKTAVDSLETQKSLLAQLENQRDAASSVSLDEEAVNIIRFQKAYQANARFITIVNELTDELVRIIGG